MFDVHIHTYSSFRTFSFYFAVKMEFGAIRVRKRKITVRNRCRDWCQENLPFQVVLTKGSDKNITYTYTYVVSSFGLLRLLISADIGHRSKKKNLRCVQIIVG